MMMRFISPMGELRAARCTSTSHMSRCEHFIKQLYHDHPQRAIRSLHEAQQESSIAPGDKNSSNTSNMSIGTIQRNVPYRIAETIRRESRPICHSITSAGRTHACSVSETTRIPRRAFATIANVNPSTYGRQQLDERILKTARSLHARKSQKSTEAQASTIDSLLDAFEERMNHTLSIELANESRPKTPRRIPILNKSSPGEEGEPNDHVDDGVVLIAYVDGLSSEQQGQEKITVCSGFAIEGGDTLSERDGKGKGTLIISCSHPLEMSTLSPEPRRRSHLPKSGSSSSSSSEENYSSVAFAMTRGGRIFPISSLLSSLPMSDLILLQLSEEEYHPVQTAPVPSPFRLRTLPISAYPLDPSPSTYLYISTFPAWERSPLTSTLTNAPTHAAARWSLARLTQYRDNCGNEATPGTYDELAALDFKLLADHPFNPPELALTPQFPPPGSSGGPILDEESGAVVGIVRGNSAGVLEGKRGVGIPGEKVFFFFALAGMGGK